MDTKFFFKGGLLSSHSHFATALVICSTDDGFCYFESVGGCYEDMSMILVSSSFRARI
jgi:hypothetical protein